MNLDDKLSEFLQTQDFDKKIELALELALDYSNIGDLNKSKEFYGKHYFYLAEQQSYVGELDLSFINYEKSFEYYKEIGDFVGLCGLMKKVSSKLRKSLKYQNYVVAKKFAELNKKIIDNASKINPSFSKSDDLNLYNHLAKVNIWEIELAEINKKDYALRIDYYKKLMDEYYQIKEINIDYLKGYYYHSANYNSLMGGKNFSEENYSLARKNYFLAIEFFEKLESYNPAFHCWSSVLNTFPKEIDKGVDNLIDFEKNFNKFIYDYEKKKGIKEEEFVDLVGFVYKKLSMYFRKRKNFEKSDLYSKKAIDLYSKLSGVNLNSSMKYGLLWSRYFQLQSSIKKLKSSGVSIDEKLVVYEKLKKEGESAVLEIKDPVEKEKFNKVYLNDLAQYHKFLALKNKYDKENFILNIDKAIEYSKETDDSNSVEYLSAIKLEHLAIFEKDFKIKIDLFSKAKDSYYKLGFKEVAKQIDLLIKYTYLVDKVKIGDYDSAINLIDQISKEIKNLKSYNPILSDLYKERYLLLARKAIFSEDWDVAQKNIQIWLDESIDSDGTKKYLFNSAFFEIVKAMSLKGVSIESLSKIENDLLKIKLNNLGMEVYNLVSLVYSFLVLKKLGVVSESVLNEIRLSIIKIATDEHFSSELKNDSRIKVALEEKEWLSRISMNLIEVYDKNDYFLSDVQEEFKDSAIQRFYKFIENLFVNFLSYTMQKNWGENWESKCVSIIDKEIYKWTFGEQVIFLKALVSEGVKFELIDDNFLKLLDSHVTVRNKLTHNYSETSFAEKIDEIKKIIFVIVQNSPILIKVISDKKAPWYCVEADWGKVQKRFDINSKKLLSLNKLYLMDLRVEPTLEGKKPIFLESNEIFEIDIPSKN
ncbi:MAG TPA: hypothetical protein PKK60_01885 [archaeon]|nr:hypothetical protein [archaeon]